MAGDKEINSTSIPTPRVSIYRDRQQVTEQQEFQVLLHFCRARSSSHSPLRQRPRTELLVVESQGGTRHSFFIGGFKGENYVEGDR